MPNKTKRQKKTKVNNASNRNENRKEENRIEAKQK